MKPFQFLEVRLRAASDEKENGLRRIGKKPSFDASSHHASSFASLRSRKTHEQIKLCRYLRRKSVSEAGNGDPKRATQSLRYIGGGGLLQCSLSPLRPLLSPPRSLVSGPLSSRSVASRTEISRSPLRHAP